MGKAGSTRAKVIPGVLDRGLGGDYSLKATTYPKRPP